MSNLISSNLIKSKTFLKIIISSNQHILTRNLLTRTNDRLLNNLLKVNQSSIRLVESDKSNKPTVSNESVKPDETTKEDRISSVPKSQKQYIFSWRTLAISSVLAAIYLGFVYYLKSLKQNEWERDRIKTLGKAAIGGEFNLMNTEGKPVSNSDFLGKWCLIYFGFTHCPDVCPEEIEKMVEVYHRVKKNNKKDEIVPIFISVDPDRDSPEIVKKYCAEFSPEIIGLTGTKEQVKAMCKNYRVYYSPGPKSVDKDYIVDHTIIMYLINPDGQFVDYYGQTRDAEMITNAITLNMKSFNRSKKGSWLPV